MMYLAISGPQSGPLNTSILIATSSFSFCSPLKNIITVDEGYHITLLALSYLKNAQVITDAKYQSIQDAVAMIEALK